jgi:4a-hydroxytetrahydrobiopterin dehydratase
MDLRAESCKPCRDGSGGLSADEVAGLLPSLAAWEVLEGMLFKRFDFKNFKLALAFVNAVGALAEAEKHHPDISFGWGFVEISLITHSADGLTRNDFILAAKIDGLGQN